MEKIKRRQNQTGVRTLQVCNKYFRRAGGYFILFPDLRLSGKWLRESGFEAGQSVLIEHENGRIVITRQD